MVETQTLMYSDDPTTDRRIAAILRGRPLESDYRGLTEAEAVKIISLRAGVDHEVAHSYWLRARGGYRDVSGVGDADDVLTREEVEELKRLSAESQPQAA